MKHNRGQNNLNKIMDFAQNLAYNLANPAIL